jgi:hypothetical protein
MIEGVDTLLDAASQICANGTRLLPVMDAHGVTLGLLTEHDVLRVAERAAGASGSRILLDLIVNISEANLDKAQAMIQQLRSTRVSTSSLWHSGAYLAPVPSLPTATSIPGSKMCP